MQQRLPEREVQELHEKISFLQNKITTLTAEKREAEEERNEMMDSYNFRKAQFDGFATAMDELQERENINRELVLKLEVSEEQIKSLKRKVAHQVDTIQLLLIRLEDEKRNKIIERFFEISDIATKARVGFGRNAVSMEQLAPAATLSPPQGPGHSREGTSIFRDQGLVGPTQRQPPQRTTTRQCHIL